MTAMKSMDAILETLNPAQREAVTTIRGPLMTLAGPGSGKTPCCDSPYRLHDRARHSGAIDFGDDLYQQSRSNNS